MKIGLFFDTYYPQLNGVATSAVYLADSLRKWGHNVVIVVPKIKGHVDTDKDIIRIPSVKAWPTLPESVRIPSLIPHKSWVQILKADYDIIHSDGNGFFSLIGLFLARKKKIPYIFTFHTVFSHYTHYILGGKLITPKIISAGLKKFGSLCDGIIVPSEKMRQELVNIGVQKPISVIPSFIDLKKFSNSKKGFLHKRLNIPNQDKIILSVGRLEKEKNFSFTIKAFELVAEKNANSHLVIVGEGSERKNLQSLIDKSKFGKQIHLAGGINMNLMPNVYSDADIYVFSSFTETQGLCVLEAAASGLPLVLAEDSAYDGMIEDGKNGFSLPLIEDKFAEKLVLLLNNSSVRRAFGEESKKIVRENFEEGALTDKIIKLYKNFIDKRKKND